MIRSVEISKGVVIGPDRPLVLIAGPDVIESEASVLRHAEAIAKIAQRFKVPYIFKCSYDKANRTSVKSYRGLGLEKGLAALKNVKKKLGIPVTSDIHEVSQAKPASAVLDLIQIPAFLSRQTDLLVAAGKTGRPINVKKGQFLAPWDMKSVVAKIESTGNKKIILTERGTTFGYNLLINDMRSLPLMSQLGYPVVFDAGHSTQTPGGMGSSSGGQAEFIPVLARAAVAAGCDAVFVEVHENPEEALCDGPSSLPLKELPKMLDQLTAIRAALKGKIG